MRSSLNPIKKKLSDTIHHCIVETLKFPQNKKAHRFINLEKDDFFYPEGRTEAYIIIEIMMISGRTVETKKRLINMLFKEIHKQLGISTTDIEICILESPASNWGFRGKTGDEVGINYKGGSYQSFKAKGNLAGGAVYQAWFSIWNSDVPRAYTADFEVYGEKAKNPEQTTLYRHHCRIQNGAPGAGIGKPFTNKNHED